MAKKPRHDPREVKDAARGRWVDILSKIGGIPSELLDGKGHPCPKCRQGTDRFSLAWPDEGGCLCRQCFPNKNSDGIAAIKWMTGKEFPEVLEMVADYLGVKPSGSSRSKPKDPPKPHATPQGYVWSVLPSMIKNHGSGVKFAGYWSYGSFMILRFNLPKFSNGKQEKEFRQIHRVPIGKEGATGWQQGYPEGLRPIYRLNEVKAAPDDLVTIHGGEKATDAAANLGVIATTNAGGEAAIKKTDWSPLARFKTAAIVIDNDKAGEIFGKMMAWILHQQNPGQIIKIVRLPNLPPKGDVVEWITAGGKKEDLLQIVDHLPTAEAIAVKLPGEVNEAEDDPHRLARVNLENYATRTDGRTIVFWRDEWYTWKRNRYKKITDKELRAKLTCSIKEEYDRLNLIAVEGYETKRSEGGKDDEDGKPPEARKVTCQIVGSVLQATSSMVVLSSDIEPGTWIPTKNQRSYVSMFNGIVDTDALMKEEEECLIPNSPQWFSMASLPYDFDPDATCPRFESILDHNLELDPERIKILQEWAGYLLLPDTGEQRFLINEGEGANGKSVFTAAMTAMLGEENVSNVPLEIFGDRFARTDTLGKLLNAAGDCGEIDKAAEGYIKSFTSGDRMFFDRKGVAGLNCRPTARLMISCNTRPRFSDRSDGVWRRMLLIPWRIKIIKAQRIKGMDKVEWWQKSGELPGIFNWAVRGLHRLRAQKDFTDSQVMDDALADYKSEVNPARQFLVETCSAGEEGSKTYSKELYEGYCKWCRQNGHNYPLSDMQFGKEVKRNFPNSEKKRDKDPPRNRYYERIKHDDSF